ncbi:hypothetical protein D3C84_811410 [compost metagenome]
MNLLALQVMHQSAVTSMKTRLFWASASVMACSESGCQSTLSCWGLPSRVKAPPSSRAPPSKQPSASPKVSARMPWRHTTASSRATSISAIRISIQKGPTWLPSRLSSQRLEPSIIRPSRVRRRPIQRPGFGSQSARRGTAAISSQGRLMPTPSAVKMSQS